jgi:hypothetical protein
MTNEETFTIRLSKNDKEVIIKCLSVVHQLIFYDSESFDSERRYKSPELLRIINLAREKLDYDQIVTVQDKLRKMHQKDMHKK